ncbi:MAG TPA: methyltransferase domain-containing protein [Anaerolineae bacterium]|nr:methyltransferase domain-containing protein [Anaerolineae bacterium]
MQIANQVAQEAALSGRVTFEKVDVQQIPYDRDSFAAVINLQMLHSVEDPVAMLNEMERVLAAGVHLFLADIRRSWLGLLDKTFRTSLTVPEAAALVEQSDMREGRFSSSLLWYRFEV